MFVGRLTSTVTLLDVALIPATQCKPNITVTQHKVSAKFLLALGSIKGPLVVRRNTIPKNRPTMDKDVCSLTDLCPYMLHIAMDLNLTQNEML